MTLGNAQEVLVSDRFVNRSTGSSVEIKVAGPAFVEASEGLSAFWKCEYLLIHDGVAKSGFRGGESWMQSFLAAYGVVTTIIKPLDIEWETPDGAPAWIMIPRLVPIGWDYDFYCKIIRFIERFDNEINAQIATRRASKSGNKPEGG